MTQRRILVVAPWAPSPTSGFGTRVFQLVTGLARNHEVTLLCNGEPGDEPVLQELERRLHRVRSVAATRPPRWRRRLGQSVSLVSATPFEARRLQATGLGAALHQLTHEQRFDVIQIESANLGWLRPRGGPALVLDEHNLEYELLQRIARAERVSARKLYHAADAAKMQRFERRLWLRTDACAVTSAREQRLLGSHAPGTRTAVVANGVDVEYFRPQPETAVNPNSIVFVGTMHYQPNVDAATHFIRTVLPRLWQERPDAVFTVVGHGAPLELRRLGGRGVIITGSVPDVRPYMAGAAVIVAPLRTGSGTRLKILEAMAMGRPVVSTSMGMEGIEARSGAELLVADDPAAFAAAVLGILREEGLAQALARRGRSLVETVYGWDRSVRSLEDLHGTALHRGEVCAAGAAPQDQSAVLAGR